MRQSGSMILSVVSNFVIIGLCVLALGLLPSCNGLKIRSCLSKPQWGGLECHDARDDEQYHLPITEADGYFCKDLSDEQDLLSRCEAKKCLDDFEYTKCEINGLIFRCKKPDGSSFDKPFEETENYVCRPPEDEETLIDYCNAKAGCFDDSDLPITSRRTGGLR